MEPTEIGCVVRRVTSSVEYRVKDEVAESLDVFAVDHVWTVMMIQRVMFEVPMNEEIATLVHAI